MGHTPRVGVSDPGEAPGGASGEAPGEAERGPRLSVVALLLAGSALLSRLLGFGREMVLAGLLGVSSEVDAYRAAFQLPDLLNYFLAGGAIGIAFIPLYTRTLRQRGEAAAADLFAVVLGAATALALAATIALWIAADDLIPRIFDDFTPETSALTVRLTRIVLPAQICFVSGGVIRGVLMARGRFVSQALAPLLYNLGIIAGGLLLGSRLGAEGFAWGALAGAVAGPLGSGLFELARTPGLRLGLRLAPRDPLLHRYLVLALPLMLGLSLLTVDEWYDRYFGQFVGPGAIAALGYARALLQLPVGIIGQAIATAALPFLTRLVAEGREDELGRTLTDTLRAGLGLGLLAGAAYAALAQPVVGLVYERGHFAADDTQRVTALLGVFAWAVPAWVVQQIAVRGFYAREEMWRPMLLGTGIAVPAAMLYWWLGGRHGAVGLAAAGALGMSANAVATLAWARWRHGAPDLMALATTGLRSAAIGGLAWLAAAQVPASGLPGTAGHAADLASAGVVFAAVALAGVPLLGDAPLRRTLARLGRRLRRGGP